MKTLNFKYSLVLMASIIALNGCASSDPFKPLVSDELYMCDNARQITVSIADNAPSGLILYEGRNIDLQRIDGRADETYSNGIFTVFYDDERIAVEREGIPILTNCQAY